MNPGDKITVRMFDAKIRGGHALEARETDLTTGQSGFMIASAANGFMNTNPFSCKGTPFNFQPEYSTARAQNIIPWGIGPYMINSQFEIGHFEPCTSVTGATPVGNVKDTTFKPAWARTRRPRTPRPCSSRTTRPATAPATPTAAQRRPT